MKCKFLIEKDHSEKEMAVQVCQPWAILIKSSCSSLSMYFQVDEVTKGIKVTILNAKKSGIKTNSVHQAR